MRWWEGGWRVAGLESQLCVKGTDAAGEDHSGCLVVTHLEYRTAAYGSVRNTAKGVSAYTWRETWRGTESMSLSFSHPAPLGPRLSTHHVLMLNEVSRIKPLPAFFALETELVVDLGNKVSRGDECKATRAW